MGLDASVYADDEFQEELGSVRIGNVAAVEEMRMEFDGADLPILRHMVLRNGTHCGDRLTLEQVRELRAELESLKNWPKTERTFLVEHLRTELKALCDIAIKHGRPITF